MNTFKRSNEPIAWSLFGAGGMVVAFIIPVLAIITGFLFVPDSSLRVYELIDSWLSHWIGKVGLFLIISLTLYHTVHRVYHGLHDLHVKGNDVLMLVLFYGTATVLSVVCAAWLLVI
jgi:fumarate reductase subunit D